MRYLQSDEHTSPAAKYHHRNKRVSKPWTGADTATISTVEKDSTPTHSLFTRFWTHNILHPIGNSPLQPQPIGINHSQPNRCQPIWWRIASLPSFMRFSVAAIRYRVYSLLFAISFDGELPDCHHSSFVMSQSESAHLMANCFIAIIDRWWRHLFAKRFILNLWHFPIETGNNCTISWKIVLFHEEVQMRFKRLPEGADGFCHAFKFFHEIAPLFRINIWKTHHFRIRFVNGMNNAVLKGYCIISWISLFCLKYHCLPFVK